MREVYSQHLIPKLREKYSRLRTLLTVHNIAYQGMFWHWDMNVARLDWKLFNKAQLEFHGQLNFLKAGLVFADLINTVSPTYAREIQTPYYGCGLQGVLSERRHRLFGIVNGVDYGVWDPATDPYLPAHYSVDALTLQGRAMQHKRLCSIAAAFQLTLPPRCLASWRVLLNRRASILTTKASRRLLDDGAQLVVLGEGDPHYHQILSELRERYPQRVHVTIGFDEGLAHQIEAGADLFLMPSLYEPSGLNPPLQACAAQRRRCERRAASPIRWSIPRWQRWRTARRRASASRHSPATPLPEDDATRHRALFQARQTRVAAGRGVGNAGRLVVGPQRGGVRTAWLSELSAATGEI